MVGKVTCGTNYILPQYYKPDKVRIARIYAKDAPRILQDSENWRIPKDYPEKKLDEIAINHAKLKKGIKNAQSIVDKSRGKKKKPSMTLKVTSLLHYKLHGTETSK